MNDDSNHLASQESALRQQGEEHAVSTASDGLESGAGSNVPKKLFLKSLAIWERQIGSVVDQVKQAIGELASRFSTLTLDLEKAVDASRRSTEETSIDDQGNKGTIVELFNQTETELGTVILALNDAQQAKQGLVREVRDFSRFTKELADMSELVAVNARMTNILALNATIEAARAGKHGDGFTVVAQEVRDLSISSATTGKTISELVASFNAAMKSVIDLTEKNAESDEASVATSESTIRNVMSRFRAVTSSLVDSASEMQETGENIGSEISEMLVSLQFQDRVSQILEHIIQHMAMLCDRINEVSALDSNASAADLVDLESWLQVMETTYATGEQRSAHTGVVDSAPDQSQVAFF